MKAVGPPRAKNAGTIIENLYSRVTGDEDARVCKDIPESACYDQPRNFFAYLAANLLGKVSDEIASAKLLIPSVFGSLGVVLPDVWSRVIPARSLRTPDHRNNRR